MSRVARFNKGIGVRPFLPKDDGFCILRLFAGKNGRYVSQKGSGRLRCSPRRGISDMMHGGCTSAGSFQRESRRFV